MIRWGERVAEFTLSDGRVAICKYKFFAVLFIFRFARSQEWFIVTPDGPHQVTYEQLTAEVAPEDPPQLNLWQRYGLLIGVAAIVIIVAIGALSLRGTTSVDDLAVGDCFVLDVDDDEFSRLTTPSCDESHDAQIVAIFDATGAQDDLPGQLDPYWETINERCFTASEPVVVRSADLPADTILAFFTPNERGWADGQRGITCYLHSPGGLDGSFVG